MSINAWDRAHPVEHAERCREWRQAHPGMSSARCKAWRHKNHKKRRAQSRRYYAQSEHLATNRLQQWTEGDLKLIVAPNRPLDRVLAQRLGRSVKAIQAMRYLVRRKEKEEALWSDEKTLGSYSL